MNQDDLKLIIGNSDSSKKATTNSRFVLPFAYKLEEDVSNKTPDLFYETISTKPCKNPKLFSFLKRRKYFTKETSTVLYDKAIWAEVCDDWKKHKWHKEGVFITLRGKPYTIKMRPPIIVLFEATTIEGEQPSLSSNTNNLQTGFLYIDIYFPEQENKPCMDDLLNFNEYFRYFDIPHNSHADHFKSMFTEVPTDYQIEENSNIDELNDPNCQQEYFERWLNLLKLPISINDKEYKLFPDSWTSAAKKWTYNTYEINHEPHWQIYADNRTYVWTDAILEKGGNSLRERFNIENGYTDAHYYGHWIKLLNIDNPSFKTLEDTHFSTQFEREWANERTYKRWEESGSWYGYTYHSGVMLSSPDYKNLTETFNLQYFDTALLLFYLRMTLFRFSNKLSELINHIQIDGTDETWLKEINQIRHEFSCFTIQYQFPMLSNQQQSVEMYQINRRHFDLDNLFLKVQSEINDTHNFLEQITARKSSEQSNKLGKLANLIASLGIPLAAAALVTSIFGMDISGSFNLWGCLFEQTGCDINGEAIIMLISTAIAAVVAWTYIRWIIKRTAS